MYPEKEKNITDQQLLAKFNENHDNKWLGILLQRYTLLLFGVCMKYLKNEELAKDSVQQIFLKVITELKKYKVEYFKSWIYMVARNYCLMQLRDKTGKNTIEISDRIMINEDINHEEKILENERTYDMMKLSLEELNREQHQCVTLFYLQKKSYLEISESTGFTIMKVKSHIQNGKRNLKLLIEKKLKQS